MKSFKSGTYINAIGYKAFSPELINKIYKIDDAALQLLIENPHLS